MRIFTYNHTTTLMSLNEESQDLCYDILSIRPHDSLEGQTPTEVYLEQLPKIVV